MTSVKFDPGQVVATPGALEALREAGQQPAEFLSTGTSRGDWGDLDEEDRRLNDEALVDGSRILSSYVTEDGRQGLDHHRGRRTTTGGVPQAACSSRRSIEPQGPWATRGLRSSPSEQ